MGVLATSTWEVVSRDATFGEPGSGSSAAAKSLQLRRQSLTAAKTWILRSFNTLALPALGDSRSCRTRSTSLSSSPAIFQTRWRPTTNVDFAAHSCTETASALVGAMGIVSFTLSEDGVSAFQNALTCIMKFSDDVFLEARRDKASTVHPRILALDAHRVQFTLTALNSTNSAYVCLSLAVDRFFAKYDYSGNPEYRDRFVCVLYIRVSGTRPPHFQRSLSFVSPLLTGLSYRLWSRSSERA